MFRVFVYGSLMSGMHNHGLLADQQFEGPAVTQPAYDMFSLGGFPAIAAGGETAILGEVYTVDGVCLARLDMLEGHPHSYLRKAIELADGTEAFVYEFPRRRLLGRDEVVSGDWRQHYGSTRRSYEGSF